MRDLFLLLLTLFLFSGCAKQSVGIGVGGVVIDGNSIIDSSISMDSQEGIHGTIAMGTDIKL